MDSIRLVPEPNGFATKIIATLHDDERPFFVDEIKLENAQDRTGYVNRLANAYKTKTGEPVDADDFQSLAGEVENLSLNANGLAPMQGSIIPKYDIIDAAKLANTEYQIKYLIDGMVAKDEPMIIGGPVKSLKTSVAIAQAMSLAAAGRFLGRFTVAEPQTVLFMSSESGVATIQSKCLACAKSMGIELESLADKFKFCPTVTRLTEIPHRLAIEKALDDTKASVLTVDPTYLALPSENLSNVFAQGEALASFMPICHERNVTLILVHHAKKTIVHNDPLSLEDFAGAGFAEFARQWLLINRFEKYDHDESPGVHNLWLSYGGSAGHGGLLGASINEGRFDPQNDTWRTWDVELLRPSEVNQAVARNAHDRTAEAKQAKDIAATENMKDRIKSAFVSLGNSGPVSESKVAQYAGTNTSSPKFKNCFGELLRCGKIQTHDNCKANNNKSFQGFTYVFDS